MKSGNICLGWNVSEMINRNIVDHIVDINLPCTERSRRYLISEGIDPKTMFVTDSMMREVLRNNKDKFEASDTLDRFGLESKKIYTCICT